MSSANLSPADFQPLASSEAVQQISRPSLSYWADAWRRLRENPRAMASLGLITCLLAFVSIGPALWQVDPSAQDLDQIGIGPGADRTVTLAAPFEPWNPQQQPVTLADNAIGLTLATPANTQAVRLAWAATGAARHRLYRNVFDPETTGSLGLPLVDRDQPWFEDRLDLQPGTYYYTLVPLSADGVENDGAVTLAVDVIRVISIAEALGRGLIDAQDSVQLGQSLTLAWHPLGTDYLGRDMLARLMYGGQVSLSSAFLPPWPLCCSASFTAACRAF